MKDNSDGALMMVQCALEAIFKLTMMQRTTVFTKTHKTRSAMLKDNLMLSKNWNTLVKATVQRFFYKYHRCGVCIILKCLKFVF